MPKPFAYLFRAIVIIAALGLGVYFIEKTQIPTPLNSSNTPSSSRASSTTASNITLPSASFVAKNVDMLKSENDVKIIGHNINYFGDTQGYFVQPQDTSKKYPGVVMIHEWWGLNENIKNMADQLAKEGYQVLAVDLFQGKIATTATEAQTLVGSLNQAAALKNLRAAVAYLRHQGASKIASLGWCFGGGQSLQLSLSGEKLNATIMYYGQPDTDRKHLATIHWPILGIFGGKDQSIPIESVKNFETTLNADHIKNSINIYPNVGHAFANPSGANYAPTETKDAWAKTLAFLKKNL